MNLSSKKRKKSSPSHRTSQIQNTERRNEGGKTPEKPVSKEKKVWSSSALSMQMKPTSEEIRYRKNKIDSNNSIEQYSRYFKCTKCQFNFKPLHDHIEQIAVHSYLKVLFCKECLEFYEDGEFSVDSDGEEKYCRWCGEGGLIYSCSECVCGFCSACIKKHFGVKYSGQVKRNNNWKCFLCFPKPLWFLRFVCSIVEEATNYKINSSSSSSSSSLSSSSAKPEPEFGNEAGEPLKPRDNSNSQLISSPDKKDSRKVEDGECSTSRSVVSDTKGPLSPEPGILGTPFSKKGVKRKNVVYSSSDETDDLICAKKIRFRESLESTTSKPGPNQNATKSEALEKLEKILRLAEYQMGFGVNWSSKMLNKLFRPNSLHTPQDLKNECQKIKWFFSILSTYLLESCSSVDSIEKSIDGNEKNVVHSPDKSPQGEYSTVVKFLDFVTNQVKVFLEKGIPLQNLLEGDIYYDNQIIGIKVKQNASGTISSPSGTAISNFKNKTNESVVVDNKSNSGDKTSEDESVLTVLESEPEKDTSDTEELLTKLNLSDPGADFLEDADDHKTKMEDILSILENA